ncbi:hypothetical protein TNCV_338951 [Trichonephila clavipes]|nr:hypothetical protein TNCV_338951 [Trichonephila clavipes]
MPSGYPEKQLQWICPTPSPWNTEVIFSVSRRSGWEVKGVFLESLVYADNPQTLDYLEDNIRPVIADIRPQMLEKVIENWTSRLDYIRASRGSHMPEIIFKM